MQSSVNVHAFSVRQHICYCDKQKENVVMEFPNIYSVTRAISISGFGGHIAISGCWSLSQSFGPLSLNSHRKSVGSFLTPKRNTVRKNRNAV